MWLVPTTSGTSASEQSRSWQTRRAVVRAGISLGSLAQSPRFEPQTGQKTHSPAGGGHGALARWPRRVTEVHVHSLFLPTPRYHH